MTAPPRKTPHGSRIPEDWPREASLPAYVCTNCGFWQRYFEEPPSCPVCLDPRHVIPEGGWEFLRPEEMGRGCRWDEVEDGIWRYTTGPPVGISSSGYVVVRDGGNVAFEAAPFYDEAALEHIESIGGISYLSASHPHSYGALWQLAERFGPEVLLHKEDLFWAKAFGVTWPFDDRVALDEDLALIHTGGHFAGHTVLHHRGRGILFSGDAVKLELADERTANGISTHKAFVRRIPLTVDEVTKYREVFAALEFDQTFTPFEQCRNVGRKTILGLLDAQLPRPFVEAMPL